MNTASGHVFVTAFALLALLVAFAVREVYYPQVWSTASSTLPKPAWNSSATFEPGAIGSMTFFILADLAWLASLAQASYSKSWYALAACTLCYATAFVSTEANTTWSCST